MIITQEDLEHEMNESLSRHDEEEYSQDCRDKMCDIDLFIEELTHSLRKLRDDVYQTGPLYSYEDLEHIAGELVGAISIIEEL